MKRLIDEEDAIRAICKNCYAEDGGDYKDCRYYPCDDVQAIEVLPSTDLERIKAIMKKANEQDNEEQMGRPTDRQTLSAEAEPTVIRSKTLLPTKDFKEWAKRIKEVNPNAVVIPCDAEVVSAEAVQGEWGHMIADGSDGSHWYEYECSHCGEVVLRPYNYCPNCGTRMRGEEE